MRNKWSDRILTVRFVISVVENPQEQSINSNIEGRLLGYHLILDSYEERVICVELAIIEGEIDYKLWIL